MSTDRPHERHEPLFDLHPVTGASIEIFFADRTLESFGRRGAGWFWQLRRRRLGPDGPAHGPFPTTFAAFRDAFGTGNKQFGRRITTGRGAGCGASAPQSMRQAAEEQIASEPARAAARAPAKSLQIRERYQYIASTIGGESGIRTHGTVSRTHAFQACALSHSAISPQGHSLNGAESVLQANAEAGRGNLDNLLNILYISARRRDKRHPRRDHNEPWRAQRRPLIDR
jgi:hypothetical protein